jgi:hypothetical protein
MFQRKSASVFVAEMSHFNPQNGSSMFHLQDYTLQKTTILTVFLKKNKQTNKLEREGYDGCLHRVILHKEM